MLAFVLCLFSRATLTLCDSAAVPVEPEQVRYRVVSKPSEIAWTGWSGLGSDRFDSIPSGGRLRFGHRAPPTLLRLAVEVPRPGRWWLVSELRTPKSFELVLGGRHLGTFGDSLPFAERPVAWADLSIPLDFSRVRETLYALVAEPRGPCEVRIHLTPDALFASEVADRTFRNAWVVGYMFSVFLVAAYLWFLIRKRAYGWYVFYFASALLWLCAKRGVGFQYLWPDRPEWNAGISVALAHMAVGGFVLFVVHLLELSRHHPWQDKGLKGMAIAQFVFSPFLFTTMVRGKALFAVEALQAVLPLWILVLLGWRAWKGGDVLARRLLLAFSPLGMAMVYGVLVEYGFFAGGVVSKASVLTVAALLENTLATLLLAWEIRNRENARLRLEREFHKTVVEQSDEFARELSLDLHDGVGQRAYALRMKVFASRDRIPEDLAESFDQRIGELHDDLRHASRRLHPPRLHGRRLAETLEELCGEAGSGDGTAVRCEIQGGIGELPDKKAIHLYRVAQEALTNALRHAQATEVVVRLRGERAAVVLEIEDNGVGIPAGSLAGRGIGMSGIRFRARAMDGSAEFRRLVGGGTRVMVRVPLGSE